MQSKLSYIPTDDPNKVILEKDGVPITLDIPHKATNGDFEDKNDPFLMDKKGKPRINYLLDHHVIDERLVPY